MKEMTNEELLDELCSENNKYVVGIEKTPEYIETLSRLARVSELEQEVELKTLEIKILNQQINGLIRGLKKNIAEYKDGIYE